MKFSKTTEEEITLLIHLIFGIIMVVSVTSAPITLNLKQNIWTVYNVSSPLHFDQQQVPDFNNINVTILISKHLENHSDYNEDDGTADKSHQVLHFVSYNDGSRVSNGDESQKIGSTSTANVKLELYIKNNKEELGEESRISFPVEYHVNIVVPTTTLSKSGVGGKSTEHVKKNQVLKLPPMSLTTEPKEQIPDNFVQSGQLRPQSPKENKVFSQNTATMTVENSSLHFPTTIPENVGHNSAITFPDSTEEEIKTGTIPLNWLVDFFKHVRNNVTSLKYLAAQGLLEDVY